MDVGQNSGAIYNEMPSKHENISIVNWFYSVLRGTYRAELSVKNLTTGFLMLVDNSLIKQNTTKTELAVLKKNKTESVLVFDTQENHRFDGQLMGLNKVAKLGTETPSKKENVEVSFEIQNTHRPIEWSFKDCIGASTLVNYKVKSIFINGKEGTYSESLSIYGKTKDSNGYNVLLNLSLIYPGEDDVLSVKVVLERNTKKEFESAEKTFVPTVEGAHLSNLIAPFLTSKFEEGSMLVPRFNGMNYYYERSYFADLLTRSAVLVSLRTEGRDLLSLYSMDQLQAVLQNNRYEELHLNDYVDIPLKTGEIVRYVVAGYNNQVVQNPDGSIVFTPGVLMVPKYSLQTKYPMCGESCVAYTSTKMFRETLPAILEEFPDEWKNMFKTVYRRAKVGIFYEWVQEKLFLLNEVEVSGYPKYSQGNEVMGQVQLFKDNKTIQNTIINNDAMWLETMTQNNKHIVYENFMTREQEGSTAAFIKPCFYM